MDALTVYAMLGNVPAGGHVLIKHHAKKRLAAVHQTCAGATLRSEPPRSIDTQAIKSMRYRPAGVFGDLVCSTCRKKMRHH